MTSILAAPHRSDTVLRGRMLRRRDPRHHGSWAGHLDACHCISYGCRQGVPRTRRRASIVRTRFAMRSRFVLLVVAIIALTSLLPVAAQTTECTSSFVNGLLRLT